MEGYRLISNYTTDNKKYIWREDETKLKPQDHHITMKRENVHHSYNNDSDYGRLYMTITADAICPQCNATVKQVTTNRVCQYCDLSKLYGRSEKMDIELLNSVLDHSISCICPKCKSRIYEVRIRSDFAYNAYVIMKKELM